MKHLMKNADFRDLFDQLNSRIFGCSLQEFCEQGFNIDNEFDEDCALIFYFVQKNLNCDIKDCWTVGVYPDGDAKEGALAVSVLAELKKDAATETMDCHDIDYRLLYYRKYNMIVLTSDYSHLNPEPSTTIIYSTVKDSSYQHISSPQDFFES